MLIPESALPAYTILHVAISLVAIAAGFIVVFGMIANKALRGWTALFLATTVATSVTAFGFPIKGVTPGLVLAVISLVVLAPTLYAIYGRRLAGGWRRVYIIGAVLAFYLNFFVLIVQSFQKVPPLRDLAPHQNEPPFVIAQVVALVAFLVMGVLSLLRFRPRPAGTP
jgi:hypothetical protein